MITEYDGMCHIHRREAVNRLYTILKTAAYERALTFVEGLTTTEGHFESFIAMTWTEPLRGGPLAKAFYPEVIQQLVVQISSRRFRVTTPARMC